MTCLLLPSCGSMPYRGEFLTGLSVESTTHSLQGCNEFFLQLDGGLVECRPRLVVGPSVVKHPLDISDKLSKITRHREPPRVRVVLSQEPHLFETVVETAKQTLVDVSHG